jgi:hypothetical protein
MNKSITETDAQEQVWQLLRELAKVIDTANEANYQLLTLDLNLVTASPAESAGRTADGTRAEPGERLPQRRLSRSIIVCDSLRCGVPRRRVRQSRP